MVCMGWLLHIAAQGMAQSPDQCSHVNAGDFVDRGAWGLEVLLVMIAWKLAFPRQVFLLRGKAWMSLARSGGSYALLLPGLPPILLSFEKDFLLSSCCSSLSQPTFTCLILAGNHETTTCTSMYGFKGELELKYAAKADVKAVYSLCKKVFALLPLAARIGSATLVLHGGLFRKPQAASQHSRVRPVLLLRPRVENAGCCACTACKQHLSLHVRCRGTRLLGLALAIEPCMHERRRTSGSATDRTR